MQFPAIWCRKPFSTETAWDVRFRPQLRTARSEESPRSGTVDPGLQARTGGLALPVLLLSAAVCCCLLLSAAVCC
eukprot:10844458-Alexandrium_andersonii.AAC.1